MRQIILLLVLTAGFYYSCKNETKSTAPVVATMTEAASKKCVHDTICAEIKLAYPVLSGGSNPVAIKAINDSLLSFVYMVIGGDPAVPLPLAFDSAAMNLYAMLAEQVEMSPDYPMGFTNELTSKVLYQNAKLISFEMSNTSFTGGAHGNYGTALNTFLLANGKSIWLTDVVQDTAALRPLLENGFVATINKESEQQYKLEELVFPESLPLPLPMQWSIVKEGLRLIYNPYEVAPYAVGQIDILLTWDQLGALADKSKWVD